MSPAIAFTAAAFLGGGAYWARALTRSGAVGACLIGGLALSAGFPWGAYLLAWFVIASVMSRVGRVRKAARGGSIVAKSDRRDLGQVLANGGVFALAAVGAGRVSGDLTPALIGAAALAAAGADTMATEVGMLWGRDPWSLRSRQRVPAGTSGAITTIGLLALAGGALLFALVAWTVGLIDRQAIVVVATAAVIGAMVDTALGAFGQLRRWCPACAVETEQPVHRCGSATHRHSGLGWLDNDVVNAACTLSAAAVVWLLTL